MDGRGVLTCDIIVSGHQTHVRTQLISRIWRRSAEWVQ